MARRKNKARERPDNTLEMQRFFTVRSDISKLIWNDPANLQILDLLEELILMAKMTDWPLLRNAALKALASAQLAPLVPILKRMRKCGF
jgi:hypothetical protein